MTCGLTSTVCSRFVARLGANAAPSKPQTHDHVARDSGPNELQHAALSETAPTLNFVSNLLTSAICHFIATSVRLIWCSAGYQFIKQQRAAANGNYVVSHLQVASIYNNYGAQSTDNVYTTSQHRHRRNVKSFHMIIDQ